MKSDVKNVKAIFFKLLLVCKKFAKDAYNNLLMLGI